MTEMQLILAELVGLRCSVAALARNAQARGGPAALFEAQLQATGFTYSDKLRRFDAEIIQRAQRVISDTFSMADGTEVAADAQADACPFPFPVLPNADAHQPPVASEPRLTIP